MEHCKNNIISKKLQIKRKSSWTWQLGQRWISSRYIELWCPSEREGIRKTLVRFSQAGRGVTRFTVAEVLMIIAAKLFRSPLARARRDQLQKLLPRRWCFLVRGDFWISIRSATLFAWNRTLDHVCLCDFAVVYTGPQKFANLPSWHSLGKESANFFVISYKLESITEKFCLHRFYVIFFLSCYSLLFLRF